MKSKTNFEYRLYKNGRATKHFFETYEMARQHARMLARQLTRKGAPLFTDHLGTHEDGWTPDNTQPVISAFGYSIRKVYN